MYSVLEVTSYLPASGLCLHTLLHTSWTDWPAPHWSCPTFTPSPRNYRVICSSGAECLKNTFKSIEQITDCEKNGFSAIHNTGGIRKEKEKGKGYKVPSAPGTRCRSYQEPNQSQRQAKYQKHDAHPPDVIEYSGRYSNITALNVLELGK